MQFSFEWKIYILNGEVYYFTKDFPPNFPKKVPGGRATNFSTLPPATFCKIWRGGGGDQKYSFQLEWPNRQEFVFKAIHIC